MLAIIWPIMVLRTRTLSGRPVGWQLTGFLPDGQTGDGWDDLLGYYQDRREVTDV